MTGLCLTIASIGFACPADDAVSPELQRWLQPQEWVRDRTEPVLALGRAGEFDAMHIFAPCVARDTDQFRLWYCGSRGKVAARSATGTLSGLPSTSTA